MLLTFLENCFVRQVLLFHSLCDWKDWVDLQQKLLNTNFVILISQCFVSVISLARQFFCSKRLTLTTYLQTVNKVKIINEFHLTNPALYNLPLATGNVIEDLLKCLIFQERFSNRLILISCIVFKAAYFTHF